MIAVPKRSKVLSTYTFTNAWANITGMTYTAKRSCWHLVIINMGVNIAAASDDGSIRLAVNGNKAGSILCECTAAAAVVVPVCGVDIIYLKKGEVLTAQAIYYNTGITALVSAANDCSLIAKEFDL